MTKEMKKLQLLVKKAGTYSHVQFGKLQKTNVFEKARHEKVTTVDRYIHRMMKRELPKILPYSVLSEENKNKWKSCDSFWVVDPIDGTTNFINRIPFFCIGVGLVENGKITKNAIYNPILKELFWAEKGKGAFLNTKRLRKDHNLPLIKSMIAFSNSHSKSSVAFTGNLGRNIRPKVSNTRSPGSTLLTLAYVAVGRFEAEIITGPITPWDTIPALLLIEEVQGVITNFEGKPYQLMKTKNLIASNGARHTKLLKLIRSTKK